MAQVVEHGKNALARMGIDLLALGSSMKPSLAIREGQAASLLPPAFATLKSAKLEYFLLVFPCSQEPSFWILCRLLFSS